MSVFLALLGVLDFKRAVAGTKRNPLLPIQLSEEANNKDTLLTSVAITSAKGTRRVLRQVFYQLMAPIVEKVDNAIHWINLYPV